MNLQGKIMAVLLMALLVCVGYIAYGIYEEHDDRVYEQGIRDGIDSIITQLAKQSADCQIVSLGIGNQTLQLVDISCIQQA